MTLNYAAMAGLTPDERARVANAHVRLGGDPSQFWPGAWFIYADGRMQRHAVQPGARFWIVQEAMHRSGDVCGSTTCWLSQEHRAITREFHPQFWRVPIALPLAGPELRDELNRRRCGYCRRVQREVVNACWHCGAPLNWQLFFEERVLWRERT